MIVSGDGTSTIMVKPPLNGDFEVTVVAKRSAGNSDYTKSSTKTINRTPQGASIEIIHNESSEPTFICEEIGLQFAIADKYNIVNVDWNASNSTISSETIVDGKRTVTIIPNSSHTNGSTIGISATVYYNGGCTTTTQTKRLKVYQPETPPKPTGYVYMNPLPEGTSVCEAQGFEVKFVASNPYKNGLTSISQAVLPPHAASRPYPITVCYINLCSDQQTCTTFYTSPPAACDDPIKPTSMTLAPNPTKGEITVEFDQEITGVYGILDFQGSIVKGGKIKESSILNITLSPKLKNGFYFIEVNTKDGIIKKQIILKR